LLHLEYNTKAEKANPGTGQNEEDTASGADIGDETAPIVANDTKPQEPPTTEIGVESGYTGSELDI
jgi:hypothetical protein